MNLLSDPLLTTHTRRGMERASLPQMLAVLGGDTVVSIPGLQRHQEDAFQVFLCYLAGAVLARAGRREPCQDEAFWREGLLELAEGREDAWRLVVDDPTRPAFMQPPVPASVRLRDKGATPDELDVLVTSKNHDVKSARAAAAAPEAWVYALTSLQTTSGYLGKGNYGIARMNGGFGSRCYMTLSYATDPGSIFRDCVSRLMDCLQPLLSGSWSYRGDGLVLTWLRIWDGTTSLGLADLHPFFIEVCRIVRLRTSEAGIVALGAPTKCARIAARELNGVAGDPWTPVSADGPKALTVSANGFSPKLLRDILVEDGFQMQPMQQPLPGRESLPCTLRGSVLVRGEGKTEGFHHIRLPIPPRVGPRLFSRGPDRERLGTASKRALEDAAALQAKVLRPALCSYLQGRPDSISYDRREVTSWIDRATREYGSRWGDVFFPWLWRSLEKEIEPAQLEWRMTLRDISLATLRESMDRYPEHHGRRYRARVGAQHEFFDRLYRSFPDLKEGQSVQ